MTQKSLIEVEIWREQAFYNKVLNGTAMKELISRLIAHFGMGYTSHILDQVKTLGFHQATATSISLGIDDLITRSSKQWLVQDVEQQSSSLEKQHHYGNINAIEKLRQSIEIWYATSEYLKQEMNTDFQMTDPSNPVYLMSFSGARGNASQVHQLVGMRGLMTDPEGKMIDLAIRSNLSEGLSLTEYLISCYGARKGVVDTAIRTADAGYLTRRLVEVVQHIVVRSRDCGTVRAISVSPKNGITETLVVQTLNGRVLADDIYIGPRCIATRNQNIGIELGNRFIDLEVDPIYIRSPFTCKCRSSICQFCYGRSPDQGDLVELGEAVGIIAGQSIGEPGTQLTLRTFHTGGVFTGGSAEFVRAPFHGKIKYNKNLVQPTRTRHGYPAFLCFIDLDITIKNHNITQNLNIPPNSLILVQNDQYIESKQVIAEIRTEKSSSPLKETVTKHIYTELGGEMHLYHTTHSRTSKLPKTSHLWILAGSSWSGKLPFPLYKDQDQMNADSFEGRDFSHLLITNNQVRSTFLNTYAKKESEFHDYSKPAQIISNDCWNLIYPSILQENSYLLAKKRRNRFLISFQYNKEQDKDLISSFPISMEIARNGGIFHRNENIILAYLDDDPRYRRSGSGIIYGTYSIINEEDPWISDQETEEDLWISDQKTEEDHLIEDQETEEDLWILDQETEEDHLIDDQETEEDLWISDQETEEDLWSLDEETEEDLWISDQETEEDHLIEDQETEEDLWFSDQETEEDLWISDQETEEDLLISDQETEEDHLIEDKETEEDLWISDQETEEDLWISDQETEEDLLIEDQETEEDTWISDQETGEYINKWIEDKYQEIEEFSEYQTLFEYARRKERSDKMFLLFEDSEIERKKRRKKRSEIKRKERRKERSDGMFFSNLLEDSEIEREERNNEIYRLSEDRYKIEEFTDLIDYAGIKKRSKEYRMLIECEKIHTFIEYVRAEESDEIWMEQERREELGPEIEELGPEIEELGPEIEELGPEIEELGPEIEELGPEREELGPEKEELGPEYEFFFIPEEVHFLPIDSLSRIRVRNNSIIGVDTWLTSDFTIRSRISGLVQVKILIFREVQRYIELKIVSGNIHFPEQTDQISSDSSIFIPQKNNSKKSKKGKQGFYVEKFLLQEEEEITLIKEEEEITPINEMYFFSLRPIVTYKKPNQIHLPTLFPQDLLQEKDSLQLKIVNYLLFGDSKPIRIISLRDIQLVRTCLVLNGHQEQAGSLGEEVHASFVGVRTNDLIRDFLKIELVKPDISYTGKRYDRASSGSILDNRFNPTNINPFNFKVKIQSLPRHQGILGTFVRVKANKACQSLILLSGSNCYQIDPYPKNNVTNKRNPLFIYGYSLGPLGVVIPKIANFDSFSLLITYNELFLKKYLVLDNLKEPLLLFQLMRIFLRDLGNSNLDLCFILKPSFFRQTLKVLKVQVLQFYLIDQRRRSDLKQIFKKVFQVLEISQYSFLDENSRISYSNSSGGFIFNPFNWSWCPLFYNNHCEERLTLGQFLCADLCLFQDKPKVQQSGQIVIINLDSLVIRSAKPYLITSGATVHAHYGQILYQGDTLATFLYEKSRSSDITQGIAKVEKCFEARSLDSILLYLKERVEGWNKQIPKILGLHWGSFIGAELSVVQNSLSLVNEIQTVYRSEGVQIHDKHIELIVRQVTHKVLVSEDRMSSLAFAFLPREIIEFSRAERAGRALDDHSLIYQATFVGITKASLNTQSFISEASFQESARVLAKAALRGRIDWLKGLKENVVLGRILPIGTGLKKDLVHPSIKKDKNFDLVHPSIKKDKNFDLEKSKKNIFKLEIRDILLHHQELFASDLTKNKKKRGK